MYAIHDEVHVDVAVFDALMLRFFKKAIESAHAHDDDALNSDWWPEFIDNVEAIERRCAEVAANKPNKPTDQEVDPQLEL